MTHCFCCQLCHEVVKRQSHEISRLLRSSLLMRQEDVEEFLGLKKVNDFPDFFELHSEKRNSQNLNFPPIGQATFPKHWTGFGEQPGRGFSRGSSWRLGNYCFWWICFPVFSQILPIGVFRGQLDWSSSVSTSWEAMTSILWGDVFLHVKMKANLVASLVGFTTRKNGWDFFSGWKWWLMGKGVPFLPANLEKSRYGASELGSCEDRQKIIQHFAFNFAKLPLTYFFSVFFGSRLFFTKLLAFLFAEVPDQKFFQRCLGPGRRGGLRSRLLVASAVVLGTFLASEIAFLGFPRQDFYRENHRLWKKLKMCKNVTERIDIM